MKKKIEISMKELFIVIGRRWLVILLCAAVIAGGYAIFSQMKWEKAQAAYEVALKTFEEQQAIPSNNLDRLRDELKGFEDYQNNNILMQVNQYEKPVTTMGIQIYSENPVYASLRRLADHYVAHFSDNELYTLLNEKLPIDINDQSARDLMTMVPGTDDLLTLTVTRTKDIDSNMVAQLVFDYLSSKTKEVTEQTTIEHELKVISVSDSKGLDTALVNYRRTFDQDMQKVQKKISDIEWTKPTKPAESVNWLQTLIVGALIGIVAGIMVVLALYLRKLSLQYPTHAQDVLHIRYLGGFDQKISTNKQDARRKDLDLLFANIDESLMGKEANILLLGALPQDDMKKLAETLSVYDQDRNASFVAGRNVFEDPETIWALSKSDAVILVERLNVSSLRTMNREEERVGMADKKVLGYMLV